MRESQGGLEMHADEKEQGRKKIAWSSKNELQTEDGRIPSRGEIASEENFFHEKRREDKQMSIYQMVLL